MNSTVVADLDVLRRIGEQATPENYARAVSDHNRRDPRVYSRGVVLTPIEGAARAGYYDVIEGRGFSGEWERQVGQWQRNYEAGRQWATAIRAIGLEPAEWVEGARVPQPLLAQLEEIRRVTGSGTRPEDVRVRPKDDPSPLHAVVPVVRRGRIIERVTQ